MSRIGMNNGKKCLLDIFDHKTIVSAHILISLPPTCPDCNSGG